jgi:hypothetical protein
MSSPAGRTNFDEDIRRKENLNYPGDISKSGAQFPIEVALESPFSFVLDLFALTTYFRVPRCITYVKPNS